MASPLASELRRVRAVSDEQEFCPNPEDLSIPGVRIFSEEVEKAFDDLAKGLLSRGSAINKNTTDGSNKQFDRWIVLSQAFEKAYGHFLVALPVIDGHPDSVTHSKQRE